MSNMGCIMSGLTWLMSLSRKYNEICADPERKKTTGYFGIYSVCITIFLGGVLVLSLFGVIQLVNNMENASISQLLMWVFVAMLIIVMLYSFAQYVLGGLMGVVYQFRCNRRPIAFVALGVFILATAGMIVGMVFVAKATVA
ncbi:MAG: hypothetical protein J1F69_01915 [Clostridiales bacterium]|nr:hypothetical protein [Clostridiales bacterium]